ncbi:unnamed protein product, partial [Musa textilis]
KVGDWGPRVHVRRAGKRRPVRGLWARGSGGGERWATTSWARGLGPGPSRWCGGHAAAARARGGRERDRYEAGRQQVRDGLLKESHISHPDIARLCQAIEAEDKIFIVLDRCAGGDLAADIRCHGIHGRVSVGVAGHFMRQLGRR